MDDEYAWAGVEDPKIVVTTSHDPSSRLKQFSKVSSLEVFSRRVEVEDGGEAKLRDKLI